MVDGDTRQRHVLAVILEDYFHGKPLSRVVTVERWPRLEQRVEENTRRVLDLLDETGSKATFYALGWIAEQMPELIAEVARRGHEVASKGYFHRAIDDFSQEEFREDLRRSRDALERASGQKVKGHRIARGWISPDHPWAWKVLAAEGFTHDSSLRPIGRQCAKEPSSRFLHRREIDGRTLWEAPVSSWFWGGWGLPFAGGNYLRQFPNWLVRRAFAQWQARHREPLVVYFHVWEIDPDMPRITATSALQRVRQYRHLDMMRQRIEWYLSQYRFVPVDTYVGLPREKAAPATVKAVESRRPRAKGHVQRPITIVVPCFNEEATLKYLANTLRRLREDFSDEYAVSLVFVDDGSSDRTWSLLNELFGEWPDCQLVRHPQNRGVAAATMTGILSATTEIVCVMDCDCTYDVYQFRRMLPMLTPNVDVVTASPYHREGKVLNVPGWRLLMSRTLSSLYRHVLHNKLATYTSCFRVYRRSVVRGMTLRYDGFLGIAEILGRLDVAGRGIVECPAVLEVRILGHSKMKVLRTIVGHLRLLTQLAMQRAFTPIQEQSGERQDVHEP